MLSARARTLLILSALGASLALPSVTHAQRSPLWNNRWTSAIDRQSIRAASLAADAEASLEESLIRQVELRHSPRPITPFTAPQEIALSRVLLDAALRDARASLAIDSANGLARYVVARVREQLDASASEVVSLARAALSALPAHDRDHRAQVLFSLGVAHTRLEQHAAARDAYLELVEDASAPSRGTALCNLAEVHMYLNEVDASLSRYQECARLLPTNATAWWGMAVAHDRAGHDADARTSADHAVSMDPDLNDINGEGVFYVPAYERHYYLAIAREAQARRPGATVSLTQALAAWRSYMTDGGPNAPWIQRVRAHVVAIEAELSGRARQALRGQPAPRGASSPR